MGQEPRKPKTNGPEDRGHFNGLDRLDSTNRVYACDTTAGGWGPGIGPEEAQSSLGKVGGARFFLFLGTGSPLKSTNQKKRCPFLPMATGHPSELRTSEKKQNPSGRAQTTTWPCLKACWSCEGARVDSGRGRDPRENAWRSSALLDFS